MKRNILAGAVVVVSVLVPSSARAQLVASAPWGEPIGDASIRFTVLASYNNEAVSDAETGLVWEQSPSTTRRTWFGGEGARYECHNRVAGNRKGWRLPTVQELASLIDPSATSIVKLPAGHPFSNVQSDIYWSATLDQANPGTQEWAVHFGLGNVGFTGTVGSNFVWCVRGGQGVNPQ